MVDGSIGVIPSVPADDHCNVCVAQPCQLVCLFDQVRPPSGELLRFGFGRISHFVAGFDQAERQQLFAEGRCFQKTKESYLIIYWPSGCAPLLAPSWPLLALCSTV